VARVGETTNGDHHFEIDLPTDMPHAEADPEKLAQVVAHLLDNAVKFSPQGGTITVAARRKTATVEVRVTDEGVGIPRSDQHRIFSKFYRVDAAPPTAVSGTGLGLFLVRGLLAAMNGRIWVESKEGEGSTFAFELPVWRAAARDRTPVEAAAGS
jgi:signal transduction histidine kinase